jgi:hypothetical protein
MRAFTPVVLSLALVAVGVAALWRKPADVAHPNPTLQVPAAALDFGTVWESEAFDLPVPITNPGPMPVEIVGWSTGCGCVSVSPDRVSLQPSETKPVVVRLNLLANRRGDDAVRPIEQVITARLGGSGEQKWVVKGAAKSFVRPLPDAAPTPQSELAPSFEPFLIPLDFRVPVQSITATSDTPLVSVRVMARQSAEGYVVETKLKDGLPIGSYPFGVDIVAVSTSGHMLPTLHYRTSFAVVPDVRFLPSTITLHGDLATPEEEIQVHSLAGVPVQILNVRLPESAAGLTLEIEGKSSFGIRQSQSVNSTQHFIATIVAQCGNSRHEVPYHIAILGSEKESYK